MSIGACDPQCAASRNLIRQLSRYAEIGGLISDRVSPILSAVPLKKLALTDEHLVAWGRAQEILASGTRDPSGLLASDCAGAGMR